MQTNFTIDSQINQELSNSVLEHINQIFPELSLETLQDYKINLHTDETFSNLYPISELITLIILNHYIKNPKVILYLNTDDQILTIYPWEKQIDIDYNDDPNYQHIINKLWVYKD